MEGTAETSSQIENGAKVVVKSTAQLTAYAACIIVRL